MAATLGNYVDWTSTGSIASILKTWYLGPVVEELNQEVMVLQLFEKATVDWNGRLCMIPLHTGRNNSTEFLAEGATFATPGQQQWSHLTVRAHFLYGHFQISGPAIASARSGGKGAFIGWMEAEMTRLVEDVKNTADNTLISGGSVVGYVSANINEVGAANWAFDGDYGKLSSALTAGMTVVQVRRQDSPGFQSDGTTENNTRFLADVDTATCNSVDEGGGTINLAPMNTTQDNGGAPGSPTNQGFAFPVYLTDTGAAELTASNNQPRGLMSNLSEQHSFGLSKEGTDIDANGLPVLQPLIMTMDPTNATQVRAPLTAERMQQVIDEVSVLSGKEPDVILCHPTTRAQYVAMMTGAQSLVTETRGKATDGDAGFLNLSYQNIPLKYGRHVPRGMLIFLNTKTWKIAELQSGSFADLDGSSLHRTGTTDEWNGYYRWYYNFVCVQPNANAILCGIEIN